MFKEDHYDMYTRQLKKMLKQEYNLSVTAARDMVKKTGLPLAWADPCPFKEGDFIYGRSSKILKLIVSPPKAVRKSEYGFSRKAWKLDLIIFRNGKFSKATQVLFHENLKKFRKLDAAEKEKVADTAGNPVQDR